MGARSVLDADYVSSNELFEKYKAELKKNKVVEKIKNPSEVANGSYSNLGLYLQVGESSLCKYRLPLACKNSTFGKISIDCGIFIEEYRKYNYECQLYSTMLEVMKEDLYKFLRLRNGKSEEYWSDYIYNKITTNNKRMVSLMRIIDTIKNTGNLDITLMSNTVRNSFTFIDAEEGSKCRYVLKRRTAGFNVSEYAVLFINLKRAVIVREFADLGKNINKCTIEYPELNNMNRECKRALIDYYGDLSKRLKGYLSISRKKFITTLNNNTTVEARGKKLSIKFKTDDELKNETLAFSEKPKHDIVLPLHSDYISSSVMSIQKGGYSFK